MSPLYAAVIECVPTARVAVVRDAAPLLKPAVPRELTPSKNSTVPVAAEGDTVAVKVTGWPTVDVGDDAAIVVVVAA